MQSAVIIGLLVVMAICLGCWGWVKHERRRQLRRDIKRLNRWKDRLTRTMRQPTADRLPPCQTESQLIIECHYAIVRACYMIGVAEGRLLWSEWNRPIIPAIHAAELELTTAEALLQMIQYNLRPLIGRMRQAASQNLDQASRAMTMALLTDPDGESAESVRQMAAATEIAAKVAKAAPVRALKEHTLMMKGIILSEPNCRDDATADRRDDATADRRDG